MPPYCLQFFRKYIELEKSQIPCDSNRVSSCFEDALEHFGKDNIGLLIYFIQLKIFLIKQHFFCVIFKDIWLEYIEFNYTLASTNGPDVVTSVYERAMRQLETELVETFIQQFCLLKMNMNSNNIKQSTQQTESSNQSFFIKTK